MDHQFQYSHDQTQARSSKLKKRLTEDQVNLLETNFKLNNKLDQERKSELANELGVPPRQVAIWFQNKRARDKNHSLEVDHKALKLQMENVLDENARLKEELERIQGELSKARGELSTLNSSSSCDEVGSSNLIVKRDLEREFYASWIGGGGEFVAGDGYNFFDSSLS